MTIQSVQSLLQILVVAKAVKKFLPFTKPVGLSPSTHLSVIGSYSSPLDPVQILSLFPLLSLLMLSSHLCLGLLTNILLSGIRLNELPPPHPCYMFCISRPSSFNRRNMCSVKTANFEASHCVIFSMSLLLPLA